MSANEQERLASADALNGVRILRRGYNFVDGSDGEGHLNAGLFFIVLPVIAFFLLHGGGLDGFGVSWTAGLLSGFNDSIAEGGRKLARAGEAAAVMMTEVRGASNAKAKQELGWQPAHPSWRESLGRSAASPT